MRRGILLLVAALVAISTFQIGSVWALPSANPLPGAIFTTLPDGSVVNGNIYQVKCNVALNGGPLYPQAHHLPDGVYDVAVTDPSGRVVLGKGEGAVTIANGEGTFGPTSLCDLVEPSPYRTTPNSGGEYKAWLCEAGSLFSSNSCKTDNFKVRPAAPPPVVTPTPTPPPGVTLTPTPVVGTPWSSPPEPTATSTPSPTSEPEMPMAFPDSGGKPLRENRSVDWPLGLGVAAILIPGGAWSIHRSTRQRR